MTDEKRPYRKTRRAEAEEQTRRRITQSAVALHGTVGPARTTISAVAEHAGVRRSTVYRHFADEHTLFQACSSHWGAENPLPDLARWATVDDLAERVHAAVGELYAYYRRTEQMWENVLRDEVVVPALTAPVGAYRDYLRSARDALVRADDGAEPHEGVRAAVGHALAFATWRSLTRDEGLDDASTAELMARLVATAGVR